MTDQQFERFLQVQTAQLAMLQGMFNLMQSMAIKQGANATGYNLKELEKLLQSAASVSAKP